MGIEYEDGPNHDPEGQPLTEDQITELQRAGDERVNSADYVDDEPII